AMRRAHIGAIVLTGIILLAGAPGTLADASRPARTAASRPAQTAASKSVRTAASRPAPPAGQARPDVVSVGTGAPSRPLSRSFLGASLEYNTVTAYEGTSAHESNPVLAQ